MTGSATAAIDNYIEQLETELDGLPAPERTEVLADIKSHIDELAPPGASEAEVLNALDRVGEPAAIARAAGAPKAEPLTTTWKEIGALLLIPFGATLIGLGWLAGVLLLRGSPAWTHKEKLAGTLLPPGGLVGGFLLFFAVTSSLGESAANAYTAIPVVLGLAVPIYLGIKLRQRTAGG